MTPPIRVGLLGAGYIADWHVRALRSVPGARVEAVCDQSRDRAAALAARCGAGRVHTSLDEMLAAGGLDAVHVLLPPAAHAGAARALAAAGVAAYVEKPLCVTAAEADALSATPGPVAVGHNFLFSPPYTRLRDDLAAGRIGRIDHITIVWSKPFGPLHGGPYGAWVFRHPAHILLEVGPHVAAHALDLAGDPDRVTAEALDPVLVPGGAKFYRRWLVRLHCGRAVVDARLSLNPGVTEHRVEVRGSAGTAAVDFEAGTYSLDRPTHLAPDFDRYRRTAGQGRAAVRQARGVLARYALAKVGLVRDGNPFGASIAAAVRAFHDGRTGALDRRLSARFGASVVRTCLEVARAAGVPADDAPDPVPEGAPARAAGRPNVLVLGGTGFIGRALVRRLADQGRRVRVLARDPAAVPDDLRGRVDVCRGDVTRAADLARALEGVPAVAHLARAHARTWAEYERDDLGATRAVAEACLAAGVRRLVYTGTTDSYYSGRDEVITEGTPLDPHVERRNLYARAKAAAEGELLALHRDRGLPVVVARPAIVIGPGGDPHHWGVGFWAAPQACRLWGDGTNPLPLVLADDVADALVRCLDAPGIDGEAFNLAADAGLSARDYVAALERALGMWIDARPTAPWRFYAGDVLKWAVKTAVRHPDRRAPSLRDWASRTYRARYDCSKARRVLGWTPTSDREHLLGEGVTRAAREWCS